LSQLSTENGVKPWSVTQSQAKIPAKAGITGTVSRLARVFGRLTTDIQIERLIVNSLPV